MSLIPKIEYGPLYASSIEFTYPPVADDGDQLKGNTVESESLTGIRQTKLNYIEAIRNITLSFVSQAEVDELQEFFISHAALGKPFRYYTDKDESDYSLYQLDKPELSKAKVTWSSRAQAFIWTVKMSLRRIINSSSDLELTESMSATILNNQASPISIAGLSFSGSTSGRFIYEIRRSTDSATIECSGNVDALYIDSTWQLSEYNRLGDDSGVVFSITSGGQIQYTSSNMSGSGYSGTITFREMAGNG
jgi:hypothetical protein